MTVIAGLKRNGKVWLGADSMASNDWIRNYLASPKLFTVKDDRDNEVLLVGVAGSARFLQVLQYDFHPPYRKPEDDVQEWLVTEVVEKLRTRVKDKGMMRTDDGEEKVDSHALVACDGRLFVIYGDFFVSETADEYAAIGSGAMAALGALYINGSSKKDPDAILTQAVEAAIHHTPYCGGKVVVKSI